MLYIILGIIIVFLLVKLKKKQEIDNSILDKIKEQQNDGFKVLENIKEQLGQAEIELSSILNQVDLKKDLLDTLQQETTNMQQLAENSMSSYYEVLENKYQKVEKEYDDALSCLQKTYEKRQDEEMVKIQKIQQELLKMKKTHESLINTQARQNAEDTDWTKFMLNPGSDAILDIGLFDSIKTRLKNPRVLNMLIWSTYFQKDMNQLCANTLGLKTTTGIYKITNRLDNHCYIGQSVDIARRWKDHAKCGLGIDAPLTNKLYKAMQKDGIWNFSWELLEECSREQLNEKEKFYIDFYRSDEVGYNSTRGNN